MEMGYVAIQNPLEKSKHVQSLLLHLVGICSPRRKHVIISLGSRICHRELEVSSP